mmetsp:Transcript_778/g.2219  ORF Transcript_778/g.2219 Transcript_778/m.2219 type:complete len:224 (+) Transcript_778:553-1224(+)
MKPIHRPPQSEVLVFHILSSNLRCPNRFDETLIPIEDNAHGGRIGNNSWRIPLASPVERPRLHQVVSSSTKRYHWSRHPIKHVLVVKVEQRDEVLLGVPVHGKEASCTTRQKTSRATGDRKHWAQVRRDSHTAADERNAGDCSRGFCVTPPDLVLRDHSILQWHWFVFSLNIRQRISNAVCQGSTRRGRLVGCLSHEGHGRHKEIDTPHRVLRRASCWIPLVH